MGPGRTFPISASYVDAGHANRVAFAQILVIQRRLGERIKSALRSSMEVQNGRVERNACLWAPSRSRSTGPHRVCKTGGPGATPRGEGLTDLVHVDEDDRRGEEREHRGHQQSADDRIT